MSRSWFFSTLVVLAMGATAWSDDDVLKKVHELVAQVIKAKQDQLGKIRDEVAKTEAVVNLQKAADTAWNAVVAKENADPAVIAARKKIADESRVLEAIVDAELSRTADGANIWKKVKAEEAKIKAAQKEIESLKAQLHKVRQELQKSEGGAVATADASVQKMVMEANTAAQKASAAERTASDNARAAVEAEITKQFNANPKVKELNDQILLLQALEAEVSKTKQAQGQQHPVASPKQLKTKVKTKPKK